MVNGVEGSTPVPFLTDVIYEHLALLLASPMLSSTSRSHRIRRAWRRMVHRYLVAKGWPATPEDQRADSP